jgi:hypothetical protein
MRRRALLAVAGTGLLGGCLGPTGTRTLPTPLPDEDRLGYGDAATAGPAEVTVWGAGVRSSAFYRTGPQALDVYGPGGHLLFLRLTARGDRRPPRDAFRVEAGGETYSPVDAAGEADLSAVLYSRAGQSYPPYAREASPVSQGRWLLFELPGGLAAEEVTAVWEPDTGRPARWVLGGTTTVLAREAPAFAVDSFSVPSTAPADGDPTARVRVRNTGPVEGTFRWALNYTGDLTATESKSLSVPAEATADVEEDLPWSGRALTVELAWSGPHQSRTVEPADA